MSLKRNISRVFIGNVCFSITQWSIILVTAKLLGTSSVGIYALAVSIVGPVFSFSDLNLRSVQATDIKNEYTLKEYFVFRICMSSLAVCVVISITYFTKYSYETVQFIYIYIAIKFIESMSDLIYGQLQKNEYMKWISISMILRGVFSLGFYCIAIVLSDNLFIAGQALIAAYLFVLIFDLNNFRKLKLIPKSVKNNHKRKRMISKYKSLFFMALPLGFVIFCNTLNVNIPRYLIVEFYGEKMLGIFAGISYFIIAGSTVVNAVGQSATPRLAKYYQNDIVAFKILLIKIFFIAMIIGILGIVGAIYFGQYILSFFYTSEYSSYNELFVYIMIAALTLYLSAILGCGLTAIRMFSVQGKVSVLILPLLLISSYILINKYGVVGGAMAIAITYLIKLLISFILLIRMVKKRSLKII